MNPLVRAIPKQGSHESVLDESRSSMFRQSVRTLPIRTCSGILILARFLIVETVPFRRKAWLTGIKRWRGGGISLERNERRKSSLLAGVGRSPYPHTDYLVAGEDDPAWRKEAGAAVMLSNRMGALPQ